jgi:hypothetical protein
VSDIKHVHRSARVSVINPDWITWKQNKSKMDIMDILIMRIELT